MLKRILKPYASAIVAGASILAIHGTAEAAQLVVNDGDVLVGFYSINSDGISVGPNTYIQNIGAGSFWRENTTSFVSIANIGTELGSTFWTNWWEPNAGATVRMVVFGGNLNLDNPTTVSGDTPNTVYISRPRESFTSTTTPAVINNGVFFDTVIGMRDAQISSTVPNTASNNGVLVPTSATSDITESLPPISGSFWGLGVETRSTLGTGNIGTGTGGYTVEAATDLYRVLFGDSLDGSEDLTAGGAGVAPSSATAYNGQYIGTITLGQDGTLRVDSVPEPSTALLAIVGLAGLAFRSRKRKA